MSVPRIVSADDWLAERKELLAAEEQAAAALASVTEHRRELPAVKVEKEYVFDGPTGTVSLLDMFEGRLQLIIQRLISWISWGMGMKHRSGPVMSRIFSRARASAFAEGVTLR